MVENKKDIIIKFENIKKRFSSNIIYDSLNLDITRGETTTIFGGSGTGKSVLLKILIGLLKADDGNIFFNNIDISNFSELKYLSIRKQIAMLFQGGALFDSVNVEENIAYPLKLHFKMTNKEMKKVIAHNLEMVGLPNTEKLMPAELSGGMQKRIGLARALAMKPKVMLYDEPTTGLDPINVTLINKLILRLKEELNLTSIVVTHDMDSAFTISDNVAMLWDKKIIFYGTVNEIKESKDPIVYRFINGLSE
jgi:phospholipid/cholesterol/gamma-HCH transport system ATP-binding protein